MEVGNQSAVYPSLGSQVAAPSAVPARDLCFDVLRIHHEGPVVDLHPWGSSALRIDSNHFGRHTVGTLMRWGRRPGTSFGRNQWMYASLYFHEKMNVEMYVAEKMSLGHKLVRRLA